MHRHHHGYPDPLVIVLNGGIVSDGLHLPNAIFSMEFSLTKELKRREISVYIFPMQFFLHMII
jgi:hypothetical protein